LRSWTSQPPSRKRSSSTPSPLEAQVAEQETEIAKHVTPATPTDTPEQKLERERIAKQLTDQQEEIRKTNEKNTRLEDEIKKERTAREMSEIRKSVETDMPKVPGSTDEVVKMIHEARTSLTKESYVVLEKALKAGSEAIAKAEKEVGGNGPSASWRSLGNAATYTNPGPR
jgi:hypothetical protein